MPSPTEFRPLAAWIATPSLPPCRRHHHPIFPSTFHSPYSTPIAHPFPSARRPRPARLARVLATARPVATPPDGGAPPPTPGSDPRGINGTTPFYLALVAAQALPFVNATSGLAGDLVYFTVTAISCIVIGVRRAPLEPLSQSAPLSRTQAIAAPFTASLFLFGTYLLLKYTSLDVGLLFNVITTISGTLCLKESLDPVFHSLLTPLQMEDITLIPGNNSDQANTQISSDDTESEENSDQEDNAPILTLTSALSTLTAVAVTAAYLFKIEPTFVFSNVIAVALCTRVLSLIRPSSFLVAAGLLTGLFCYDIFWVFGSEVMVSVATQIDSPGKLLFPRGGSLALQQHSDYPFAILGLGDVCIPGIFISLAQSLDSSLVPSQGSPYFVAAVSAYVAGLMTCFAANLTTSAAQPALLYLVPALIASSLGMAAYRGEFSEVLTFKAEGDDEDVDVKTGETSKTEEMSKTD